MRTTTRGYGMSLGLTPPTPVVKKLLIANVAVFLVTFVGGRGIVEFLALHPNAGVLTRPWGLFTYMFVHGGLGHLFVNMLGLFFFGPPLEASWGGKEFFRFYVIAALGGAALSFVFASEVPIIGASAAVYGVMLAFAMNWPNSLIYIYAIFPVKAKWVVGFMFAVTVVSAFSASGGGIAHFAHLGGLLTALAYLKLDWRTTAAMRGLRQSGRKVRRMAIVPQEETRDGPPSRPESGWSASEEGRLLDEVDRVLDKISEQGITSLTPRERRVLDEASRRHGTN